MGGFTASQGNARNIHSKGTANGAWPLTSHVPGSGSRITPIYWSIKPEPFLSSQASRRFPPTPSHASVWLILFQEQLLPLHHHTPPKTITRQTSSTILEVTVSPRNPFKQDHEHGGHIFQTKNWGMWSTRESFWFANYLSEKFYDSVQIKSHVLNHTLICMEKEHEIISVRVSCRARHIFFQSRICTQLFSSVQIKQSQFHKYCLPASGFCAF